MDGPLLGEGGRDRKEGRRPTNRNFHLAGAMPLLCPTSRGPTVKWLGSLKMELALAHFHIEARSTVGENRQ